MEIVAEFTSGLDLEAIFLAGTFGVILAGRHATLGRLPDTLSIGDIATQGLPFYSGKLTCPLHEVPKEQAACGPTSFRTRGDKFSEEYQLFPCGLATAPKLSFGRG